MLSSSETKGSEIHSFTIMGCGCDSKSDTYTFINYMKYILLYSLYQIKELLQQGLCAHGSDNLHV